MESIIDRYRRLHSDRKESIVQHFKDAKRLSVLNYYRAGKNGTNNMDYFFYGVMAIKDFLDESYQDQAILGSFVHDYEELGLEGGKTYKPSDIFMARLAKNVSYVAYRKMDYKERAVGLSTPLGIYVDEKKIEKTNRMQTTHINQIFLNMNSPSNPYTPALNQVLNNQNQNSFQLVVQILTNPKALESYTDDPAHFITSNYTEKHSNMIQENTEIFKDPTTVATIKANIEVLSELASKGVFDKDTLLQSSVSSDLKELIENNAHFITFRTMFHSQEDLSKYTEDASKFVTEFYTKDMDAYMKTTGPLIEFLSNPDVYEAVVENKDTLLAERDIIKQDTLFEVTVHELLHSGALEYSPKEISESKIVNHYKAAQLNSPALRLVDKLYQKATEKNTQVRDIWGTHRNETEDYKPGSEKINPYRREKLLKEFKFTPRNESLTENLVGQIVGKPTIYLPISGGKNLQYICPTNKASAYCINQPTTNLLITLCNNDKYNIVKSSYLHFGVILGQLPFWNHENNCFRSMINSRYSDDGKVVTESTIPQEFKGYIDPELHIEVPSFLTLDAMLARTQEVYDQGNDGVALAMSQRTQQMLLETYKTGMLKNFEEELSKVNDALPPSQDPKSLLLEQSKFLKTDSILTRDTVERIFGPANIYAIQNLQAQYLTMKDAVSKAFTTLTILQDKSATTTEERVAAYNKYGCQNIQQLLSQPQTSETINDLIANNIIAPTSNIMEYVQVLETIELLEQNHPILSSIAIQTQTPTANNNSQLTPQPMVEDIDEDPLPNSEELLEQDTNEFFAQDTIITDLNATKILEQNMQTQQITAMPTTETVSTEIAVATESAPADDLSQ